jgi:hypothetical protein
MASPGELLLSAAHDADTDTDKTAQEAGTTDPDTEQQDLLKHLKGS